MASRDGLAPQGLEPPLAMLAELTHRCPLQCPYCSNPTSLARRGDELDSAQWVDVMRQAAALGVLQAHLSGGEPTARKDLADIVAGAHAAGIYTNLITSGVLLTRARLQSYQRAGLDHVQISIQDSDAENADRIGNYAGGHVRKLDAARAVREAGLPLTINAVVHRQNLDHLPEIIELARGLDAQRLEIANVQYYGWALRNRAALMPTRAQVERATEVAAAATQALAGEMTIDYVVPDYYARRPKRCMDGWGNRFFAVTPRGRVLPCHAAETITGMEFSSLLQRPLRWIWEHDPAFNRFRGTDWMPEPCRSCEFKHRDLGGCRCQAYALTGDVGATDPVCEFSPHHALIADTLAGGIAVASPEYVYRA